MSVCVCKNEAVKVYYSISAGFYRSFLDASASLMMLKCFFSNYSVEIIILRHHANDDDNEFLHRRNKYPANLSKQNWTLLCERLSPNLSSFCELSQTLLNWSEIYLCHLHSVSSFFCLFHSFLFFVGSVAHFPATSWFVKVPVKTTTI